MNPVVEEILMHYGIKHRSGRYPWGSGKNPYQRTEDFLARIEELKKQGMSEKDIADDFGLKTTQYRIQKSLANSERRADLVATAKSLREKGYSLNAIAAKMGYDNDSSVRSLLNADSEARMNQAQTTAKYLKDIVDQKGMIQVGSGVETELGISKEKLNEALYILELEGYPNYTGGVPQATNAGKQTIFKVLGPPGTEHKDIYKYDEVSTVKEYDKILTEDGTRIRNRFENPSSLDSKRLMINYAEDGGSDKDGVIEIRRGLDDINLGNAHYAQIRMMVDGTHYLKGMCVYADDLPDGVDVRFNTNKSNKKSKMEVLKEAKTNADGTIDESNPFGALLRQEGGQTYYDDPKGKFTDPVTGKKQSLSPLNKTRIEGDWDAWDDTLASQFLAKQSLYLIDKQLNLTKADKKAQLDEILALDNPVIKKSMLMDFADDCDASAVHLRVAALPRQRWQVILPLTSIGDKEIYAPNFKDGEEVVCIRYPHGGTFEIPRLIVNNKNKEGRNILGNDAKDVVGISKAVADRLSGADFDGDTVLVIPTNGGKTPITSTKPLDGLKDFDPKMEYGGKPEGTYKRMKEGAQKENEMGKISNLITDMTLLGAPPDELARAVRHSMVVIDAPKHGLDYKQSEIENGIQALRKKYQEGGASTLISRAKGEYQVPKRQGSPKVLPDGSLEWKTATKKNKETGEIESDLYYEVKRKIKLKDERGRIIRDDKGEPMYKTGEDGKPIWEYTGKTKMRTQKSTKMAELDPYSLISKMDTPQERAYADYANYCKELAKTARKEAVYNTPSYKYDKSAKEKYSNEWKSLDDKLVLAKLNRPRERQAQLMAASIVSAQKKDNPNMSKAEQKKIGQKALTEARIRYGAQRQNIDFTEKEWEAIQAGAISPSKLKEIIQYSDKDRLRQLATPRATKELSDSQKNLIKTMSASGYTNEQIAERIGRSVSTVIKYS